MKKTIIAIAVLSMFSNVAYAKADPCNNPNPPAVCSGSGSGETPPRPGDPPGNVPFPTNSVTVSPIINPTTLVNPENFNTVTNSNVHTPTNTNSSTAFGGNSTANSTSSSQGGAGGIGIGGSVGNSGNSTNSGNNTGQANVVVQGDQAQARDPVATAIAPTVVTGTDQCLVPIAVGGQAVGFGVSVGAAVRDENCEILKLSRQVEYLLGKDAAVKFLRMNDKRVDDLLKAMGR